MKLFMILSLLFISQLSFGATAQVNNVFQMTGTDTSATLITPSKNPDGYFSIYCGGTTISTGRMAPCFKNGSATQYKVANGSTWHLVKATSWSGSGVGYFQIVSASAAFAFNDTTASLTTPLYQCGAADSYAFINSTSTVTIPVHAAVFYDVVGGASAGNVGVQANTSGVATMWLTGYESTP